ncbi:MAG: ThiF family adenylyltransferase [Burkholderiales bacterium]|nr:ThiF family adenylyltransferase [Burkholderiales bacterium]
MDPLSGTEATLDSADAQRRFGGLARLYGDAGAKQIRQSHVVVVGVGGVGSWAVECLARSGVRALTLIDLDHISESNINRQLPALSTTLGMSKVVALQQRIALIHPECEVHTVEEFIAPDNCQALLSVAADAVIDACDNMAAKQAMAAWALTTHTPFITVGAAGGKRLPQRVDVADLADVTHDPLLSLLRQRLRKENSAASAGKPMGLAAVFSKERVLQSQSIENQTDHSLNCHGYGSVVTVTATFGNCAAAWVLGSLSKNSGH